MAFYILDDVIYIYCDVVAGCKLSPNCVGPNIVGNVRFSRQDILLQGNIQRPIVCTNAILVHKDMFLSYTILHLSEECVHLF